MTRVVRAHTPLGEEQLMFRSMRGVEGLSQLFEFEVDLLSPSMSIDMKAVLGKPLALDPDGRGAPLPQRPDRPLHHDRQGRRHLAPHRLPRERAALALVSHAQQRLQDLPEQVGGRDPRGGVRRLRLRLREKARRQLPAVGVLRAVPGNRLRLRQPADGARRHLLLLRARQKPAHAGAGRRHRRARAAAGLSEDQLPRHRPRPGPLPGSDRPVAGHGRSVPAATWWTTSISRSRAPTS